MPALKPLAWPSLYRSSTARLSFADSPGGNQPRFTPGNSPARAIRSSVFLILSSSLIEFLLSYHAGACVQTAHSEFLSAIHALPWLRPPRLRIRSRCAPPSGRTSSNRMFMSLLLLLLDSWLLFVCLTRKTSALIGGWFSSRPIEPSHERGAGSVSRSMWLKATVIAAFSL